jgi:hypothetical protein
MGPVPAEQEDTCWSKGARIGRSGGHIVEAATAPPAATHRRTAASMEKAQPQQRRRLEPPLLGLSHYPTLAGAVRQLDGTGANGPRRPPAGAVRLGHAERPGPWPVLEGTASSRAHRRTGLPRWERSGLPDGGVAGDHLRAGRRADRRALGIAGDRWPGGCWSGNSGSPRSGRAAPARAGDRTRHPTRGQLGRRRPRLARRPNPGQPCMLGAE